MSSKIMTNFFKFSKILYPMLPYLFSEKKITEEKKFLPQCEQY